VLLIIATRKIEMQCRYCQHKTYHDHKHRKRLYDVINSMPYYEVCIMYTA